MMRRTRGKPSRRGSVVNIRRRELYVAKDNGRDRLVVSGQIVHWPAKSA